MIYVYSPLKINGLPELLIALDAKRISRFDGEAFWSNKMKFVPEPGSVVIPFGTTIPAIDQVLVLNASEEPRNKYKFLKAINQIISGSVQVREFGNSGNPSQVNNAKYILRRFKSPGLLADMEYLSARPQFADYYTVKGEYLRQVRIHSFNGKSIRAGQWTAVSAAAHPWIRTEATGWKVDYSYTSATAERALAHKTVKALDLQFGVVDLGITATGGNVVLQVNTIPDLSTPSAIAAYAKGIKKFIEGVSNAV